jgi:hypothetical protein
MTSQAKQSTAVVMVADEQSVFSEFVAQLTVSDVSWLVFSGLLPFCDPNQKVAISSTVDRQI